MFHVNVYNKILPITSTLYNEQVQFAYVGLLLNKWNIELNPDCSQDAVRWLTWSPDPNLLNQVWIDLYLSIKCLSLLRKCKHCHVIKHLE